MNHFTEICNTYGCYELTDADQLQCSKHYGPAPYQTSPGDCEIKIYKTDKDIDVSVQFDANNEVWLTDKEMATLYGVARNTLTEHRLAVIAEDGLVASAVSRKFRVTAPHSNAPSGVQTKEVLHSNLDLIFLIGMRVHSPEAKAFRQWALEHLKAVAQVGYSISETISEERIAEMAALATQLRDQGIDAFKGISAAIVQCSDYHPKEAAHLFIKIRSALLYTVTKLTQKTLIIDRLKTDRANCGLNPGTAVTVTNARVALNYLTKEEHTAYITLATDASIAAWLLIDDAPEKTMRDVSMACLSILDKTSPGVVAAMPGTVLTAVIHRRITAYNNKPQHKSEPSTPL